MTANEPEPTEPAVKVVQFLAAASVPAGFWLVARALDVDIVFVPPILLAGVLLGFIVAAGRERWLTPRLGRHARWIALILSGLIAAALFTAARL